MELFAMPSDGSGAVVPLALYPPGYDTNNLTIFEASWPGVMAAWSPMLSANTMDTGGTSEATPMYSGAASESTRGPKRKPRVGVKNKSGTFGICYQTAEPGGFYLQQPRTQNPLQPFTGADGGARNNGYMHWDSMSAQKWSAYGFAEVMKAGSYKQKFNLSDSQWGPNDIKSLSLGGNSIFRTCNFGLLSTHGCYGTYPEIDGVYYTYLALGNGGGYLRLSDMAFGSPGADGAKWMTILSCNMLNDRAITSMANHSKLPSNGNLHLLLGFNSYAYSEPWFGLLYASNMVAKSFSIHDSFINACTQAYKNAYQNTNNAPKMDKSVTVRIMGYNSCFGDTLYQSNDPDPNTGMNFQDTPIVFTQ
jgi:hypothetical protein